MNDLTAQALASTISGVTMAFLGVPALALVWAFIGAFAGLYFSPIEGRAQGILTTVLSGLVGAAMGYASARWLAAGNISLQNAACMICGAGAKPLLAVCIEGIKLQFQKWSQK